MTWDENDVDRVELNEKVNTGKLSEIPDSELRKFVAYSSEEEEEEEDNERREEEAGSSEENGNVSDSDDESKKVSSRKSSKKVDVISKYKNLLNDIAKKEEEKKKNKVQMEFSWGIDADKSSQSIKNGKSSNETEVNPFEKLVEKKREKKRARKEKIRQLKKQQNESDDSESEDDLPDGIDLNDPYFAEEFANGEFAPVKSKKKNTKKTRAQQDDEQSDSDGHKDLELLLDDDDNKAHFSLKKIQERENETKTSKKRRKKLKQNKNKNNQDDKTVEDDFQINATDNRFSAIYSSHLFNIDPTDSHYRKTKAMETLIHEKLKRKSSNSISDTDIAEPNTKKRKDVANSILVKSIKRKVQQQK